MVDSYQNFARLQNDQGEKVIKLINPFKDYQQNRKNNPNLFLGQFKKCRCCFSELIQHSGQHLIESWHRQAFLAMSGVELSTPDSENYLCLHCAEILKIFVELGQSAINMQKKYYDLVEDLASDIKSEAEETRHDLSNFEGNFIVSDDDDDNEQINLQQQNTLTDMRELEIYKLYENVTITEEIIQSIDEVPKVDDMVLSKFTVHLTRLDAATIGEYEYYSVGDTSIKNQIISYSKTCPMTPSSSISALDEINTQSKRRKKLFKKTDTMCHLCGKITKNGKALNEHLNFVHIKKMSCDLCGKSCPRKRDLMNHIQTHHMKVSFKCTKCPRAFQSQQKLAKHQRAHNKPFKCGKCNATFAETYHLSEHTQVRHEGKRWHCSFEACSGQFTSRGYAVIHLKKLHTLNGDKFKKCLKKLTLQ